MLTQRLGLDGGPRGALGGLGVSRLQLDLDLQLLGVPAEGIEVMGGRGHDALPVDREGRSPPEGEGDVDELVVVIGRLEEVGRQCGVDLARPRVEDVAVAAADDAGPDVGQRPPQGAQVDVQRGAVAGGTLVAPDDLGQVVEGAGPGRGGEGDQDAGRAAGERSERLRGAHGWRPQDGDAGGGQPPRELGRGHGPHPRENALSGAEPGG